MKSLMQIAQECNLRYNEILGVTQREKIEPALRLGRKIFFDKYQEDYLHTTLYFSGKINEITYTSKL
jgi:hypothetical protein